MSSPETKIIQFSSEPIAAQPKHVLETYRFDSFSRKPPEFRAPIGRTGFEVQVVAADDYRVSEVPAIEAEAFEALKDKPEEVIEEFKAYNGHSVYFLVFDAEGAQLGADTPDDIVAVARMIPYKKDLPNKSLTDLADIAGWDVPDIPTRDVDGKTVHDPQAVLDAFCIEADCDDLTKVWDMSTMAPRLPLVIEGRMTPGHAATAVLTACSLFGIEAYTRSELTHITAFSDQHADKYFRNIGYPFKDIFGLPPLVYATQSGTGMIAQPSWLEAEEFIEQILVADPASYLGRIAIELETRGTLSGGQAQLEEA